MRTCVSGGMLQHRKRGSRAMRNRIQRRGARVGRKGLLGPRHLHHHSGPAPGAAQQRGPGHVVGQRLDGLIVVDHVAIAIEREEVLLVGLVGQQEERGDVRQALGEVACRSERREDASDQHEQSSHRGRKTRVRGVQMKQEVESSPSAQNSPPPPRPLTSSVPRSSRDE